MESLTLFLSDVPTDPRPSVRPSVCSNASSERDSHIFCRGHDAGGVPTVGKGVHQDGIHLCRDPGDRGVLLQTQCEKAKHICIYASCDSTKYICIFVYLYNTRCAAYACCDLFSLRNDRKIIEPEEKNGLTLKNKIKGLCRKSKVVTSLVGLSS